MTPPKPVQRHRDDRSVSERLRADLRRAPVWLRDLAGAALVLVLVLVSNGAAVSDWRYYAGGADILFGPEGLRIYADHAEYQLGPLSLAVARVVMLLPGDGQMWAQALTALLLVPTLVLCRRALRSAGLTGGRWPQVGWVALVLGWVPLVAMAHFGESLALLGALAAVVALLAARPAAAGWWLAAGVAAKPWTLVLLPLLLFAPSWAQRRRALGVAALVGLLVWAPFMLAAPMSLGASTPTFVVPDEAWQRIFGVGDSAPAWWRPAQLVVCWLVGLVLWTRTRRTGAWVVGMLVAGGALALVRLITDLGTWPYYLSVALPLVWLADRAAGRDHRPWPTLLTFLPVLAVPQPFGAAGAAAFRVACLSIALTVLLARWWRAQEQASSGGGSDVVAPTGR